MNSRHPLSRDPQGENLHFWGGIILLIVLVVSIRWARTPLPTQPPQINITQATYVPNQAVPIPRVEEKIPVVIPTDKAPVVTPLQMPLHASLTKALPAYWKFSARTPAVNSLLVLPTGIVWAATEGGLVQIIGDQVSIFNKANGGFPAESATSLAYDGNAVWIGTFEGLFKTLDGRSFQKFTREDGIIHEMVWSLFWDGTVLWVGTQKGFSFLNTNGRFDSVDKKISNGGLADLWIGSIIRMGKWVLCGNDDGLSIWDTSVFAANPKGWTTIDMFSTNLAHNWILSQTLFQDKIWVGTPKGLCRLETPVERIFLGENPSWQIFNSNRGLPSDKVDALLSWENSLWVATSQGLARWKNGIFKTLSANDGLLTPEVRALGGASETIWIGTTGGIQALNIPLFDQ